MRLTHLSRGMRRAAANPLRSFNVSTLWLLGMLIAFLWFFPFLWMLGTSFRPDAAAMRSGFNLLTTDLTLQNYVKVFHQYPISRWATNSFIVSLVSTLLGVSFGAMAGYALARLRFPGRQVLFALLIASMMIPTELTVVPLLIGFIDIGWSSTYKALILPAIAQAISVYIFRQFYLKFPVEIEEAAIVDGASRWTIFWKIALPMARSPAIAATVILFTMNWNNFLWPLLVTFDQTMKTMPVGVAAFAPTIGANTQLEGYGAGMAAVTLLSAPSLMLFFLLQRYFISGLNSGSIKG